MPWIHDIPETVASATLERLIRAPVAEQTPPAMLQVVVDLTPTVLPGAIEASVTLLTGDRPSTAASSGPLADELDARQYSADAGPCLHAARTGELTQVSDNCTDPRWPAYSRLAAAQGALTSLSLPLRLDVEDDLAGSLNIYAHRGFTFVRANRAAAARFAGLASLAVSNLAAYQRARERADHLNTALTSRAIIEQAKGILMERHRYTEAQAFAALARASKATNRNVGDLAEHLVRTGELPGR